MLCDGASQTPLSILARVLYSPVLLRTRMSRSHKQIQVLMYQDVLCPWSWLAELRLSQLQRELSEVLRFVPRPYPLRPMESLPSEDEISRAVKDLTSAAREREALPLRPDLWTSGDPPRSSMEPLAALESARLQGEPARLELQSRLRHAAMEQGLNVTRPDIVLELAERAGLDLPRFAAAFAAPASAQRVRDVLDLALDTGVREIPALVIGDEWLVAGARSTEEYAAVLRRYLAARLGVAAEQTVH